MGKSVTVQTGVGPVVVAADDLVALAVDPLALDRNRLDQLNSGRMPWSLGPLGDLLWMIVPETRPLVVELFAGS